MAEPPISPKSSEEEGVKSGDDGEEYLSLSGIHQETLFRKSFLSVLESEEFSDVVLVCGEREYNAHRLILSYSSAFFRRMLLSDFKESKEARVNIGYNDDEDVFPLIIQYMYKGTTEVPEKKAVGMYALADHFLMEELKQLCSECIVNNITRHNALLILEKSLKHKCTIFSEKCINVVAKNFCNLAKDVDFSMLPPAVVYNVFSHPKLACRSEFRLYRVICKYLEKRMPDITSLPDQETRCLPGDQDWESSDVNWARALLELPRYPFFSLDQLQILSLDRRLPRFLVVEGLMARLEEHEDKLGVEQRKGRSVSISEDEQSALMLMASLKQQSPLSELRHTPRRGYGIPFEYRVDYGRGILYYIATNGGRSKWKNPALSGAVRVTASSLERGELHNIVGQEPCECWTKDVPASWFAVDMGERYSVIPTYVTLRHGGNYRADSLRNWDFQGSKDGQKWVVLRRHVNDCSLNKAFQTCSWMIPGCTTAYRHFRILQTSQNSSHHNFLVLSGFELYGELYEHLI